MDQNERSLRRAGASFWNQSLTQHKLAVWCAALFALSVLPLIVIALYNYPADDDFAYTLPAATAWVQTHSPVAVLQAIAQSTLKTYNSWQGDFISTFLFALNPMILDIKLYFLANWYQLALLCLSVGYLLRSVTAHWINASASVFWIVYPAVMVLVLQFMPSIAHSVYWYNGGQYTTAACGLMLALGLILRCGLPQSARRALFRGLLLALLGFALGGSFFGPALGAFVIFALISAVGLIRKSKARWHALVTLAFFTVAFALSIAAPGNALRQERTGESLSIVSAVVTSVLDSFDLAGRWLSPQLLAVLLLILPALWHPLKASGHAFRHPLLLLLTLYAMFAASLTPGVYTGFGYTTERYLNVVYFYFLITAIGSAVYGEGALIRRLERSEGKIAVPLLQASESLGKRVQCGYLVLCLALLTLGGFANTIMTRPSISAVQSIVTGDAARFYREMQERQEYIRVTDSDVVAVRTLSVIVPVFKPDKLPFQGIYGTVRYMKWYFELFHDGASTP